MTTNCPSASQTAAVSLHGRSLSDAAAGWLLYGELEGWSERTVTDRRWWLDRLLRFVNKREFSFDTVGLRAFFHALSRVDPDAGCQKPLKPASVLHVHILLKAFGSWLVEEGIITDNPMKKVPRPIMRDESIKPFDDEDLTRLFAAADKTKNPTRDKALTSFLSDTGVRASELCALTLSDVDLRARTAQIRSGKGGKSRMVVFGKQTAGALWRMLRIEPRDHDAPLFIGERGGRLTPNGLSQLMRRLGKAAGVEDAHPHRWRHDCACRLLRNGAHVFSVARLLGHSRITTTEVYVNLSQTDIREMHRTASPVDRLRDGKTKGTRQ